MSGLKIAALYSYRPHILGLCGPKEALKQQTLRKFLLGKISAKKIEKVLKEFKGAYPYYKLIARNNQIRNPFAEKVIKAYWIGNNLLDKVKIDNLRQMIINDFSGPALLSKKIAVEKAKAIPKSSKPHHSFHVLRIGSVTGSVDFKNIKLKDLCRVGWGRVIVIPAQARIQQDRFRIKYGMIEKVCKIIIKYQPLVGEKRIKFGNTVKKEIIWEREIVPHVKIGNWVSFHWDFLVQVLTKDDVKNLKKYSFNSLKD